MSFRVLHLVLDEGAGLIDDPSGLALAMVLASWANDEGQVVYQQGRLGMAQLASILRLSDERSVRRVIQRLEAVGVLVVDRDPRGGRGARNAYTLNVGLLESAPSRRGRKGDNLSPITGDGERGTRGTQKPGQGGPDVPLPTSLKGREKRVKNSPPSPPSRGGTTERLDPEVVKSDWRELVGGDVEPTMERPDSRAWARRVRSLSVDRGTLREAMRASGGKLRRRGMVLETSLYNWLEPANIEHWAQAARNGSA